MTRLGDLRFWRAAFDGPFRQGQLVRGTGGCLFFLDAGLHCASCLSPCRRYCLGRRCVRQFAAELIEVGALNRHDLAGFCGWDTASLVRCRNLDDSTRPDAIDVAVDESVRVGAQQRDQHLIQGNLDRLVRSGDSSGRVAWPDRDGFARSRRLGCLFGCSCPCSGCRSGFLRGRRSDRGGWQRAHSRGCRGGRCGPRRRRSDLGRSGCNVRGCPSAGGVKQKCVIANKPPRSPLGFQNQVKKRLGDDLVARKAKVGTPVRTLLQRNHGAGQRRIELHARSTEGSRICNDRF